MSANYVDVPDAELADAIAVGMHTGLRKGSEAPNSAELWQAISASHDSSWSDAARFCVDGLRAMGYEVRRAVNQ